jgi:hypothetical protein
MWIQVQKSLIGKILMTCKSRLIVCWGILVYITSILFLFKKLIRTDTCILSKIYKRAKNVQLKVPLKPIFLCTRIMLRIHPNIVIKVSFSCLGSPLSLNDHTTYWTFWFDGRTPDVSTVALFQLAYKFLILCNFTWIILYHAER